MFSMVQFRDGPFIRPHPAFWRAALGINLLYELALVFLLFQDLGSARKMMTLIDPNLGVPLPEKSYAENCDLTPANIWVGDTQSLHLRYACTQFSLQRMPLMFFVWLMLWDGLARVGR